MNRLPVGAGHGRDTSHHLGAFHPTGVARGSDRQSSTVVGQLTRRRLGGLGRTTRVDRDEYVDVVSRDSSGLTEYGDNIEGAASDIQRSLSSWFPSSTHPGGFAWELATGQLPDKHAVAREAGEVVGWAAFSAEDSRVECATGDTRTATLLAGWLLDTAGTSTVSVAVYREQSALRDLLTSQGFVDEQVPLAGLRHPAGDTGIRPPSGYRVRPLDEGEEPRRLHVHRAAWKPSNLPFTDDTGDGISPDAESRMDPEKFRRMQSSPLYRRDLDLVIEAADGSIAGSCTAWLDPSSGWVELEPLGIVPEHRRRGLAQVLALEVCRRAAGHGGREVFINTAPLPYYRAPWEAYRKAGFTPALRGTRMRRPASRPS